MQVKFNDKERKYTTLILKDALTGAREAKAKGAVKQAKRLLNKFSQENVTTHIKLSELKTILNIVKSSVITLNEIKARDSHTVDKVILESNLKFGINYTERLDKLIKDTMVE